LGSHEVESKPVKESEYTVDKAIDGTGDLTILPEEGTSSNEVGASE